MIQVFRHGIDITRHQLKGIYVVTIGTARKSDEASSRRHAQVICTLREGPAEDGEDWSMDGEDASPSAARLKNSPITLSFRGQQTTLRPWDPSRCALSAALHNRLVHFPVQPKTNVFAICWSLQSMSHISDMLGPTGRLIAVLSRDWQLKAETVHRFVMRHANTTVIFEDIKEASFERYERMLSLPDDSRYAFLMALHPRLGANSPARILKPEATKICKHIFDFLVCTTPGEIKSLVIWHGNERQEEGGEEVSGRAFDQALKHVDILHRWRKSRRREKNYSEGELSQSKERIWVMMDLRINPNAAADLDMKLVNEMATLGLVAKEQLSLTPWFPNHGLLLFQCGLNQDDRKSVAVASGLSGAEDVKHRRRSKEAKEKIHRPPSAVSMPVPNFTRPPMEAPPMAAPFGEEASMPSMPGFSTRMEPEADIYGGGLSSAYPADSVNSLRGPKLGGQMMGNNFGPPGLVGNSMQGNQPWMGSEESKLLSYLQARQAQQSASSSGAQPSHWPPGLNAFPDQAPALPPQPSAQQAQWQQAAMLGSGGLGAGPCVGKGGGRLPPQWPQMGQGQSINPAQLPFVNFGEDPMNFMPLNL